MHQTPQNGHLHQQSPRTLEDDATITKLRG